MKEILDKISSYNFFNYLLPGILFVVIVEKFTFYSFIQENIIIGIFLYYFIGLVISRFGSLIIEPFLKRISFIKFSNYADFISASEKDSKIEIFSEINNMYRTFISMFFLILLLKLYELIESIFPALSGWNFYILFAALLTMFLYSYRKQTKYISSRVNKALKKEL